MSWKTILLGLLLTLNTIFAFSQGEEEKAEPNRKVHTFYYGWFATPEQDGRYSNWNHPILPHWRDTTWNNAGSFPGGDDIGANFYPALGCYSANDTATINQHMKWMKEAGIGVLAISWWGPGSFTDKSVNTYLDLSKKHGLELTFHIEPVYKTPERFREIIQYIVKNYGDHPALFKHEGKPMYYVYDSHKVKYPQWNKLFAPDGELSLRNTPLDGVFIGHWERRRDGGFFLKSGFDGYYTYYASEGYMYGCTSSNWPVLADFARKHDLLFIPCPGPGYKDTRIRPWNDKNTEDRKAGRYYENMFRNAASVNPDYIGITSFNEWHEGTQIEPAIPKTIPGYTYEDYGEGVDPMFYIHQTRELAERYLR